MGAFCFCLFLYMVLKTGMLLEILATKLCSWNIMVLEHKQSEQYFFFKVKRAPGEY